MSVSWARRVHSIRSMANSFQHFKYVVDNYDEFDAGTTSAIMKAAPSVASLISHVGDKLVYLGSGTIIECDKRDEAFVGTILTSASLLRGSSGPALLPDNLEIDVYFSDGKLYEGKIAVYDFYHNIALVKIECTVRLSVATLRLVDDAMTIYSKTASSDSKSNGDLSRFKLFPGEPVIALARYFLAPYDIMASPGVFSAFDSSDSYKEFFLTSCIVTKFVVGGPLVNYSGEVIGINFLASPYCAFVPINVVLKCVEDLKKTGIVPRPWLGVDVTNLYIANLDKLNELTREFPHVVKGVVVEQVVGSTDRTTRDIRKRKMRRRRKRGMRPKKRIKVQQESPASRGGLFPDDVIIRCCGQSVGSHLELAEALWDKEGKSVELLVVRPSAGKEMTLNLTVETNPMEDSWRLPAYREDLEELSDLCFSDSA